MSGVGASDLDADLRGARRQRARQIRLGFVFLWFLIGGLAHFMATRLEIRIVPPYIHWPRTAVLLSGVCELAGAGGPDVLYPQSLGLLYGSQF
jgi:uncharacterized membrane protein